MRHLEQANSQIKVEWWLSAAEGGVNRELAVNGHRLPVAEDKNNLEMDIGNSCK